MPQEKGPVTTSNRNADRSCRSRYLGRDAGSLDRVITFIINVGVKVEDAVVWEKVLYAVVQRSTGAHYDKSAQFDAFHEYHVE